MSPLVHELYILFFLGVLYAIFGEGGRMSPNKILPSDDDLQGAAQALVRLHNVYK